MCFIKTLNWFGDVIQKPLDENKGEDAARYIKPSQTLTPKKRIEIYNQQYWWRLLNTLHDSFPFLVRLFGYHDFNCEIGIPLLRAFPPSHWSLNQLGERMVLFLQGKHEELVVQAAAIDFSFTQSFIQAEIPFSEKDFDGPLYLQPHLFLFSFSHDLFQLREEFLNRDVEYWIDHSFPESVVATSPYFVLYRNHLNQVQVETVSETEFLILKKLEQGVELDALVDLEIPTLAEHLQKFAAAKWIYGR